MPINGAYGSRLADLAERLSIPVQRLVLPEHLPVDPKDLRAALVAAAAGRGQGGGRVTHVALVHCETTTGILNDVEVRPHELT